MCQKYLTFPITLS
ncbi:UNVERIFIED_CONTAM: hypothetical protein GTU68_005725 [Idotea baltica]|nr:hypothetical protein [Idotea baltica]